MHVVHLAEALDPARFRTRLITGRITEDEGDMTYYARERGVEVTEIAGMSRLLSPLRDLRSFLTLLRIFRRERPKIVHTHTAKAGTVARLAAMAAGVDDASVRSTLTVAVIEADPREDGARRAWLHGVGDSPAFLLDPAEGTWSQLTPTDDGPANRVHNWVPDGIDDHFSAGVVIPAGHVLVVSTDGFSGALGETLGRSLAELWRRPPDVFAFGRHLGFDHGFDDKTVVAVWNFPVADG